MVCCLLLSFDGVICGGLSWLNGLSLVGRVVFEIG